MALQQVYAGARAHNESEQAGADLRA